ncbi:hypothetical protein LTR17_025422, partial [Elasticomyces elasticus]
MCAQATPNGQVYILTPLVYLNIQAVTELTYGSLVDAKTRLQRIVRQKLQPGATTRGHKATAVKYTAAASGSNDVTHSSVTKKDAELGGGRSIRESPDDKAANGKCAARSIGWSMSRSIR